jgi:hypothetical protein
VVGSIAKARRMPTMLAATQMNATIANSTV